MSVLLGFEKDGVAGHYHMLFRIAPPSGAEAASHAGGKKRKKKKV
jgi:hypothetical protein